MAFDSPPYVIDGTTVDGEVIRRAIGSLISPSGGVVSTGDLAVAQHSSPNMSVDIAAGECWVPGSTSAIQGPYYGRNHVTETKPISASSASNPRIDTVIVQVKDPAYAGATESMDFAVIDGTPTPGATLVNLSGAAALPASSLVIAYVLVPASATTITNADIANVSTGFRNAGMALIPGSETTSSTSYALLPTPDQVTGLVVPAGGLIEVAYQAIWNVNAAAQRASAAIFLGANQLQVSSDGGTGVEEGWLSTQTTDAPLTTFPLGLASTNPTSPDTQVTTGQAVGFGGIGARWRIGATDFPTGGADFQAPGGPCQIRVAPGIYTLSVRFKVNTGALVATVKNRSLYARVLSY